MTISSATTVCDCCGEHADADTTYPATDDRRFCAACIDEYRCCDFCNLYCHTATVADDGYTLCSSCAEARDYTECERCGVLVRYSSLCTDHQPYRIEPSDEVHDYGYKPDPVFHGTGPRYLGLELEITVPLRGFGDRVHDANTMLGDLGYLKEDSSISHGFELVTHPMAYPWAITSFPWALLDHLARRGCTGAGNGLHVHISRDAFTDPCHIFRWMKFIHRNAHMVQILARRSEPTYAAFTQRERASVKHSCKGLPDASRHVAINTHNRTTFELRVFASSLKTQQVQAALAFADATVRYARDLTIPAIVHNGGWDWFAFTDWLHTRPEYTPLIHELEDLACAC